MKVSAGAGSWKSGERLASEKASRSRKKSSSSEREDEKVEPPTTKVEEKPEIKILTGI